MIKATQTLKLLAFLPLVFLLLSGCNPIENDTESASLLMLVGITGNDFSGQEADFLQSDVISGTGVVTADVAKATFTVETLDPAPLLGTSTLYNIQLSRYRVSYFRSDGKNMEGTDIPYSFEGSLSGLVLPGSAVSQTFIIVREVAKLEAPLINLAQGRGEGALQVTAKIEFFGQDMTQRAVKTTGYLTIFFANYVTE